MSITPIHGTDTRGVPLPVDRDEETKPLYRRPRPKEIRYAERPEPRTPADWAKWITLAMAAAAMLVALVVWAQSNLDGKASRSDVQDMQMHLARMETDLIWIKVTLGSVAKQTGSASPP